MDDHIGSVKLPLDSACVTAAVARSVGAAEGATVPHVASSSSCEQPDIDGCRCRLRLPIQAAPGVPAAAGHLLLELRCRAACCESSPSSSSSSSSSSSPRVMLHRGPVRYRISMSALAGALTGHNQDDGLLAFAAYKVNLAGLSLFFQTGASVHWNTNYDKARLLFNSVAAVQTVRMQHSLLYKDDGQQPDRSHTSIMTPRDGSRGVLRGGGDLVVLLRGGVRAQQRRYYTYVLMDDGSWRFSETGAAFFSDIMSKHAMHAGCAEKVVYAGEFCLLPGDLDASWSVYQGASLAALVTEADAAASTSALAGVGGAEAGNWTLVADNNSGTYAPPAALLPALAALLRHNFPGLRVEVLERNDARLVALRSRVPSRGAG
ncbi:hypothetical protein VOLCADRAFT_88069 [Volvox carteri f. nagariensis]|uniref:Uncharacterized protein n=1 Tax=Volvox carteri f. nagariensis TaxID=3068 RepID=D8TMZ7_VOLCA|nr:uncharacterized protein VOLCADRAFT_88069 [Volvox carteri f. nagariensis]EFJ51340.1 hypothetical protein VOLCADRAFT_88069 [Volvox carteri f. nagariensis]|eukprot:XP_002947807.1 hypothetical protein VOLCADRAFT_88069 [Volvox carteri f. nagariensis]